MLFGRNLLSLNTKEKQMKMDELFEEYDCDTEHRVKAIFSCIFILQNRMQTAGENVRLLLEGNNSVRIELTDKVGQYAEEIGERHSQFLKLLFTDFNKDEIDLLFRLYVKLFAGIEWVEKYAEKLG